MRDITLFKRNIICNDKSFKFELDKLIWIKGDILCEEIGGNFVYLNFKTYTLFKVISLHDSSKYLMDVEMADPVYLIDSYKFIYSRIEYRSRTHIHTTYNRPNYTVTIEIKPYE